MRFPMIRAWRPSCARLRLTSVVAAVLATLSAVQPAAAQSVVQPLPDPAVQELAEATEALERSPQSLDALLAAAAASLKLADHDGALDYLTRAEAVSPSDGRVKAGFASLMLRHNHPVEGLQLFAEAEQLGAPMANYASELGLARDLVGDNAGAQRYYWEALAQSGDDEVRRRLALSLAIAGNRDGSEGTLLPMTQRGDLAAYRARAFALAILGEPDEAVAIAEAMLPPRLSSRLAPYLRYMPRLTRAQQAAAVHLGHFPRSDEIGRDDPAIVALAGGAPVAALPQRQGSDARLVPSGPPMGGAAASSAVGAEGAPARVADLPPPDGRLETVPRLSEAFIDFEPSARVAPSAAPGAVDIAAFEPPREARSPTPAEAHPARHWVQIATGRDRAALGFDWRRIRREAGGLLDEGEPHLAAWGSNNRLLVGPFEAGEAQRLVTALKGVGVDTFRFSSSAGQEVRPLY